MASMFVKVSYKDMYNKNKSLTISLILPNYGRIKKIFRMWVLCGEGEASVRWLNV